MARVHVVGASGAGTTTLGLALAHRLGCPHLDTDDFFWLPSEPDYQFIRPRAGRQALLAGALARDAAWVLSGSLCGWGDVFIPQFDLVVFLLVPPEIRLARLRARERERYGAAIEPGGPLHERYVQFVAWAAMYDDGTDVAERCRLMHEQWLAALPGPPAGGRGGGRGQRGARARVCRLTGRAAMKLCQFYLPGKGKRVGILAGEAVLDVTAPRAGVSSVTELIAAAGTAARLESRVRTLARAARTRVPWASLDRAPSPRHPHPAWQSTSLRVPSAARQKGSVTNGQPSISALRPASR